MTDAKTIVCGFVTCKSVKVDRGKPDGRSLTASHIQDLVDLSAHGATGFEPNFLRRIPPYISEA